MARRISKAPTAEELLRALEQAKSIIAARQEAAPSKEDLSRLQKLERNMERAMRDANLLTLAVLQEEPCPIRFFKPWMSYPLFSKYEKSGDLVLIRKNGKTLCRPSDFFAFFKGLPASEKNKGGRPRKSKSPNYEYNTTE